MENFTEIEKLVEPQLIADFGESEGKAMWGAYAVTRQKAVQGILPHVSRGESELTDHGPAHIGNVFRNAYRLLGFGRAHPLASHSSLSSRELYVLSLSVLFHDLGNIHGRENHQRRLAESFEYARGTEPSLKIERRYLFSIVEAHCGQTLDGSRDTISPLETAAPFREGIINCQQIAAILRLADELAEGPQRTSVFVQKHLPYQAENQVYHDFAGITDVTIDPEGQRIVLEFNIDISFGNPGPIDESRLSSLLKLSYLRGIKLDLERKYNRHFCSLLAPFRRTEISYHFYFGSRYLDITIPKIVLDDLVLPVPLAGMTLDKKEKTLGLDTLLPNLRCATKQNGCIVESQP